MYTCLKLQLFSPKQQNRLHQPKSFPRHRSSPPENSIPILRFSFRPLNSAKDANTIPRFKYYIPATSTAGACKRVEQKIIVVIVSVFLSSVCAVLLDIWRDWKKRIADTQAKIDERLDKVLAYSIQYPYLEDIEFARQWDSTPVSEEDKERKKRYDNYCCFVFNFLQCVFEHHKGDAPKMRRYLYYPEFYQIHQDWWRLNKQINDRAYNLDFRCHVDAEIATQNKLNGIQNND